MHMLKPTIDNKVATGGIAGALVILLISIITRFGVEITPTEGGAMVLIMAKIIEYFTPNG